MEHLKKIPAKVCLAGHETGIFRGEIEKLWDDYSKVINQRERKLVDLLDKPCTFQEIVGQRFIFGRKREPKVFFEFGECAHMKKHLKRLMKLGIVFEEGDRYSRKVEEIELAKPINMGFAKGLQIE